MSNYEVVHTFFSPEDRKVMGKVSDLIIVDKVKGYWCYITYDGCPMIGDYSEGVPGGYCEWEEIGDMSVAEVYELNLLFVRLYGYVIDDLLCQHERRGTLTTSRRKYKHEAEFACHKREE